MPPKLNAQWELDTAIRYDQDKRSDTTDTPAYFLRWC